MPNIKVLSPQAFVEPMRPKSIRINDLCIDFLNCNWNTLREIKPNDDWWLAIIHFLERFTDPTPTIDLQTSGSTGRPKLLTVEKYKLYNSALKTIDFFKLDRHSTGLLCLSANYIAGKMMLVRAMISGMRLVCIEPKTSPLLLLNESIDFAAMIPMQVKASLTDIQKLNNIKNLIIGGGQVDYQLTNLLQNYTGNAYETFGMTETYSHIALRKLNNKPETYFTSLIGVTILKDAEDALIIDSPDIGAHKLKTNDIIELKSNHEFKWLGRKDFIINTGGIKVSPELLETTLSSVIQNSFCILGLPDEKLGEKIVLVIEGEIYNTAPLEASISSIVKKYARPKEIFFIKTLPLTGTGKIKRKEVLALLLNNRPS